MAAFLMPAPLTAPTCISIRYRQYEQGNALPSQLRRTGQSRVRCRRSPHTAWARASVEDEIVESEKCRFQCRLGVINGHQTMSALRPLRRPCGLMTDIARSPSRANRRRSRKCRCPSGCLMPMTAAVRNFALNIDWLKDPFDRTKRCEQQIE
jgi:hypothetical protein